MNAGNVLEVALRVQEHRSRAWLEHAPAWYESIGSMRAVTGMQLLGSRLSRVMLLAIEVAVEYWLALTWSPQAQWLNEIAKTGIIQDEVR